LARAAAKTSARSSPRRIACDQINPSLSGDESGDEELPRARYPAQEKSNCGRRLGPKVLDRLLEDSQSSLIHATKVRPLTGLAAPPSVGPWARRLFPTGAPFSWLPFVASLATAMTPHVHGRGPLGWGRFEAISAALQVLYTNPRCSSSAKDVSQRASPAEVRRTLLLKCKLEKPGGLFWWPDPYFSCSPPRRRVRRKGRMT
jgi:hypothetical protein